MLAQKRAENGKAVLALACFQPDGGTAHIGACIFFGEQSPADAAVEISIGDSYSERSFWEPMDTLGSILLNPDGESFADRLTQGGGLAVSAEDAEGGPPIRISFNLEGVDAVLARLQGQCRR